MYCGPQMGLSINHRCSMFDHILTKWGTFTSSGLPQCLVIKKRYPMSNACVFFALSYSVHGNPPPQFCAPRSDLIISRLCLSWCDVQGALLLFFIIILLFLVVCKKNQNSVWQVCGASDVNHSSQHVQYLLDVWVHPALTVDMPKTFWISLPVFSHLIEC